ncbi:YadA-like family protein [Taylorella asinigenitalis]|uniref:YadA-like family protein n=1 Tax=Taylorella asinigenitalis TaxID=84590 RepID=UPI00048FD58E|nr:YadA-like family protein [Taylorella asinigenitalis]
MSTINFNKFITYSCLCLSALSFQFAIAAPDADGNEAIGSNAIAKGKNNKADGVNSTAMGNNNNAKGPNTTAMGIGNKAEGPYSTAIGLSNEANKMSAAAVGYQNLADGHSSNAIGIQNEAKQMYSSAIGHTNKALEMMSSAIGYGNTASGKKSTAVGVNSTASGKNSMAVGSSAKSIADDSLALGSNTKSTSAGGIALGAESTADREAAQANAVYLSDNADVKNTVKGEFGALSVGNATATRQITNVAAGTENTDAVNVAQLKALQAQTDSKFNNQLNGLDNKFSQRIENLDNKVNKVDKRTNAIAAQALAAASLVPTQTPGKGQVSVGVGTHYGQTGYALGVSYRNTRGDWTLNVIGAGNSQGRFGAAASANFQW